jgi:hypothetical protein
MNGTFFVQMTIVLRIVDASIDSARTLVTAVRVRIASFSATNLSADVQKAPWATRPSAARLWAASATTSARTRNVAWSARVYRLVCWKTPAAPTPNATTATTARVVDAWKASRFEVHSFNVVVI